MTVWTRVLIALVCLFLAIACFTFGIKVGGAVFVILGIALEGMFWWGLFGSKRARR